MDGREAKCSFRALGLQRAWSTLGASPDVSKEGKIADIWSKARKPLLLLGELGGIAGDKNAIDSGTLSGLDRVALFDMLGHFEV
jgi:hypothetical protein